MKTKGKPQAAKPSPLPSEHAVLRRVLDSVRDYLKKKDYELYREAMNEWENVAAAPPAVNAHAGLVSALAWATRRLSDHIPAVEGSPEWIKEREAIAALRAAGEEV